MSRGRRQRAGDQLAILPSRPPRTPRVIVDPAGAATLLVDLGASDDLLDPAEESLEALIAGFGSARLDPADRQRLALVIPVGDHAEVIARLASDPSWGVRAAVAARPELVAARRRAKALASDDDHRVRRVVAANPRSHPAVLKRLARRRAEQSMSTLCSLAANPSLDQSDLRKHLLRGVDEMPLSEAMHMLATASGDQLDGQWILNQAAAANPARDTATTDWLWERAVQPAAQRDRPLMRAWTLAGLALGGGLSSDRQELLARSLAYPDEIGLLNDAVGKRRACMVCVALALGPNLDAWVSQWVVTDRHAILMRALAERGASLDTVTQTIIDNGADPGPRSVLERTRDRTFTPPRRFPAPFLDLLGAEAPRPLHEQTQQVAAEYAETKAAGWNTAPVLGW